MGVANSPIVRVGVIGCGEIAQVAHIPTLSFLSDFYQITYLCDVSEDALQHCQRKVAGERRPRTTRDPAELCGSGDVDVVFVINSSEYHVAHASLALQHDKHVFVEKPMAFNMRDAVVLIEAEKRSKGKLMVGYMRRYAPAFVDAVQEIGGFEKITYARVRDIIGPNSAFVNQSGTFPKKFGDFRPEDTRDAQDKLTEVVHQGLTVDCATEDTSENRVFWQLLGGLGSHDLSVMREALGMPIGVLGASIGSPFWNVLFQYDGFCVSYESGIDNIPRFDAHIEVYSMTKSIRVEYDTPYVKGLPITMHVRENADGVYKETMMRRTYEDPYTIELKELYNLIVHGTPVKTTAEDASQDLDIFRMIMQAAEKGLAAHANGFRRES